MDRYWGGAILQVSAERAAASLEGRGRGWMMFPCNSCRSCFRCLPLTTDTSHSGATQSKFGMMSACIPQVLWGLGRHRRCVNSFRRGREGLVSGGEGRRGKAPRIRIYQTVDAMWDNVCMNGFVGWRPSLEGASQH